jgi:hypothetical protein
MADSNQAAKPDWKKALKDYKAIGWIVFLILVLAIGFGTIIFGDKPAHLKSVKQATTIPGPSYAK